MSQLRVNEIVNTGGTGSTYAPGHIVQVVAVDYAGRVSQGFSSNTIMNITGLEATITPKKANSKILIQARWFGEYGNFDRIYNSVFGISRNDIQIGRQTDPGATVINGLTAPSLSYIYSDANSTPETAILFVTDSPNSTSPLTYRMTILADQGATLFTNRMVGWTGQVSGFELGTSGIVLMEIAQ
jgi:hypothetical protein